MSSKLSTADEMALYKSRFDQYISECNDLIIRFYGFQQMNEYTSKYNNDESLEGISD